MGFIQSIDEFLQHKGFLHQVVKSGTGATSVTTTSSFECFAFFGELERTVADGYRFSHPFGWSVLFKPAAKDWVVVGNLVTAITDSSSLTVISTATIQKQTPYRHWSEGLDLIVAEVEPN